MKITSILCMLTLFTSCAGLHQPGNFFGAQEAAHDAAHASQAAAAASNAAAMHHMHHTPPPPPPPMSGF